jgi:hypothetical protein
MFPEIERGPKGNKESSTCIKSLSSSWIKVSQLSTIELQPLWWQRMTPFDWPMWWHSNGPPLDVSSGNSCHYYVGCVIVVKAQIRRVQGGDALRTIVAKEEGMPKGKLITKYYSKGLSIIPTYHQVFTWGGGRDVCRWWGRGTQNRMVCDKSDTKSPSSPQTVTCMQTPYDTWWEERH